MTGTKYRPRAQGIEKEQIIFFPSLQPVPANQVKSARQHPLKTPFQLYSVQGPVVLPRSVQEKE